MNSDAFEPLRRIRPGQSDGKIKPHKFALLMAIIDLYEEQPNRANSIHIDSDLEKLFEQHFGQLAPESTYSPSMIEAPFFHLQMDLFWLLHVKEEKVAEYETIISHKNSRFTKKRILDVFSQATLSDQIHTLFGDPSSRAKAKEILMETYMNAVPKNVSASLSRIERNLDSQYTVNPFVNYLNSLQRSGGSNENALAESQACNDQFASIHVAHPLADIIQTELSVSDGKHVILTGHAGDGKSTLALELYKRFSGLPSDAPLTSPPQDREDVGSISILKDLSERDKHHDEALIAELMSKERRFLLVSNTGTLLDLIKQHPAQFQEDSVILESRVLDAISTESGEGLLSLGTQEFRVFNLARMDNLSLSRKIFEKMLAPEQWAACEGRACNATCPIHINVSLMQRNHSRVLDRIFLAYRRMYEYGTRLTMRQFTEHLAYMITSGLDEADIQALQQRNPRPLITEYLFFNRFFGDNGSELDLPALEMKAIQEIREQGFGGRPCPGWEHRLWLRSGSTSLTLGIDKLDVEFEKMRRHGSREAKYEGMTADQAREQVRRMLFFLFDFKPDERTYLGQYLNSPTLLDWLSWQNPKAQLGFNEKTTLERKIYHVIQEHFTGVRLPEGSMQNDRRLYVTLSRRRSEVRQSAQVVLAQVDWSTSTALKLVATVSATGELRQDLVLCGKDRIDGANLVMKIPFLDYVMMRHFGELGEVLEASYLERLDHFKAQVHAQTTTFEDDRIMLVRLKTDHTFRRQHFFVNGDRLEVTDVL
jgi:hypothetical protein